MKIELKWKLLIWIKAVFEIDKNDSVHKKMFQIFVNEYKNQIYEATNYNYLLFSESNLDKESNSWYLWFDNTAKTDNIINLS